jgi:hydrogenase nickel incorporation protein HypB
MCATCGCSDDAHHDHHHHDGAEHGPHEHGHEHGHGHGHGRHQHAGHEQGSQTKEAESTRRLRVERDLLGKNALAAERNRGFFVGRGVLALNFVSSPGSGKTSLLERTIEDRGAARSWFVVQGDQATDRDAERVRQKGARAVQLNTGTVCHLDAEMVARAVAELDPAPGGVVAIENVGNLVCPALFDLGEHARIVVASVAEGADKPIKYPYMFRTATLVILNKLDLEPYVDFDREYFAECVRGVNPDASILALSATRGDGLSAWYDWLDERFFSLATSSSGPPPAHPLTAGVR